RALVEVAAGEFEILIGKSVEHVVDGEVVAAETIGIDVDVNLALRAAENSDLSDALGVFELLLDLLIGDEGDIAQRAWGADSDLEDGRSVRIELLDDGLLRGGRKLRHDQVDLLLHFLRGDVAVLR